MILTHRITLSKGKPHCDKQNKQIVQEGALNYLTEIISGVFALLVVWLEVRMTQERKQAEKHAAIRAKESKLAMKMQDASLSLSLATCIAVERGETNGEMKTAREKAKTAQEEYEDFVHELASEQATSI